MTILIFLIVSYILLSISLYFVFEKAGEAGWKALVPGYNFVVMSKLVGRNGWHAAWLLFPIVNIFIFVGLCIDMVRSFGKYGFWHSALAVIYAPIFFFYLGLNKNEKYKGPTLKAENDYLSSIIEAKTGKNRRKLEKLEANNPYRKSQLREWTEAIFFAVFAAAFIRMFLIEAYVIPTSSMEGSLLVGDFLFVSKARYGIRTPQTIAMIPLLHNRTPVVGGESYLENPKLPYFRLPAFEKIDRNDPVVFNYPEGDSVYVFADRTWSIHDYRRNAIAPPQYVQAIKTGRKELVTRPMDKKDHYIKRCVAISGDSVEVRNRQLYVNGQPAENPTNLQFMYMVQFPTGSINTHNFSDWGISPEDIVEEGSNYMAMVLSEEQKEKVQSMDKGITITPIEVGKFERNPYKLFPHDPQNYPGWTVDDYGPVWIPKKGTSIDISPQNIALYRRVIGVYEGNDIEEKAGKIYINGEEASTYTFKMDYFWMMGDNRHNSEDARVWGFVPEDHVVGKPLFIWFSTKEGSMSKGIRWERIFSSATKK
ncbi:MAG: S26 family signal peptidase [Bacteroidetes bacterium]|nr:S26 family signal peptidase [Bacteroidota bacterium]